MAVCIKSAWKRHRRYKEHPEATTDGRAAWRAPGSDYRGHKGRSEATADSTKGALKRPATAQKALGRNYRRDKGRPAATSGTKGARKRPATAQRALRSDHRRHRGRTEATTDDTNEARPAATTDGTKGTQKRPPTAQRVPGSDHRRHKGRLGGTEGLFSWKNVVWLGREHNFSAPASSAESSRGAWFTAFCLFGWRKQHAEGTQSAWEAPRVRFRLRGCVFDRFRRFRLRGSKKRRSLRELRELRSPVCKFRFRYIEMGRHWRSSLELGLQAETWPTPASSSLELGPQAEPWPTLACSSLEPGQQAEPWPTLA